MKFDLYFFFNAMKHWLPWRCSADKILPSLLLSSRSGLLYILSCRSLHLNVFSKGARYEPEGTGEVLARSPPWRCVPADTETCHCGARRAPARGGPAGAEGLPRPPSPGQLEAGEETSVHLPQYKLDVCFRMRTLILSYLWASRCLAERTVF